MPRIDSYDPIESIAGDDLLLISDTSANNTTNSVEVSSLASHINIGKQNQLTLTTTGTSGAATLTGATLNIPQYSNSTTFSITDGSTTGQMSNGGTLRFTSGTGISAVLSGSGSSSIITITNSSPDTGLPAILNTSGTASLSAGVTATEVRTLISAALNSDVTTNANNITTNTDDIADLQNDVSLNATNITGKVAKAGDTMSGDLAILKTTGSNPVLTIKNEETTGGNFQTAIINLRAKDTGTNTETVGQFQVHGPNSINTGGASNLVIQNQTSAGGQVVIAPRGSGGTNYWNRFKTNGQLQLEEYGSGTLTGTVAYNISVDASGNLIETSSLTQTTGTYTPQLIANTPSEWVISSYSLQQGKWVRIGNMVFCDFTITIPAANISGNTGSTSGLTIQGWPYDHDGGGSSFQEGTLNQCNGFDVEVKGTNFTLNSGLGNAKLNITKQDTTITTYFQTTSLKAGDFNNGNQVSIIGSFSYLTTGTATLNSGATIDP